MPTCASSNVVVAVCRSAGSSGYDPPLWPPKGIEVLFAAPYSPQAGVVVIALVGYYVLAGLWGELAYILGWH